MAPTSSERQSHMSQCVAHRQGIVVVGFDRLRNDVLGALNLNTGQSGGKSYMNLIPGAANTTLNLGTLGASTGAESSVLVLRGVGFGSGSVTSRARNAARATRSWTVRERSAGGSVSSAI